MNDLTRALLDKWKLEGRSIFEDTLKFPDGQVANTCKKPKGQIRGLNFHREYDLPEQLGRFTLDAFVADDEKTYLRAVHFYTTEVKWYVFDEPRRIR